LPSLLSQRFLCGFACAISVLMLCAASTSGAALDPTALLGRFPPLAVEPAAEPWRQPPQRSPVDVHDPTDGVTGAFPMLCPLLSATVHCAPCRSAVPAVRHYGARARVVPRAREPVSRQRRRYMTA